MSGATLERIEFQLTDKCPFECLFCVNSDSPAKSNQLDLSIVDDILQRVRPKSVTFTGGEPTIDMPRLGLAIKLAREVDAQVQVNTAGELLGPDGVKELFECGMSTLHVSLDGADEATYNRMRGRGARSAAAFNRLRETLQAGVRTDGLAVVAEITATRYNVEHVPLVYRMAMDLGLSRVEVQGLIPRGRATRDMCPSDASLARALEMTFSEMRQGGPALELWSLPLTREDYPHIYDHSDVVYIKCTCGRTGVYVDASGAVSACNFTGLKVGSVHHPKDQSPGENLLAMWEEAHILTRIRQDAFASVPCISKALAP